ncbi:MarR family winged helix-turn-helix transcriptional regulator [Glutamicibacter uratoxydans]|uniref:MarR family winged helix-turn-helix transcriptional regulator n=1 Tax=Glutamicibacter uratoxydans TaxID=43667 RepID=UPI003D6EEAFC
MSIVDQMVCFSLYAASRATTRAYTELLAPWKLTYTQYLVLVLIWTEGEQSVRQLGDNLHLDSGTLSPLLRRLEQHGYLERYRDEQDSRIVRVRPTSAGQELREQLAHIPERIACATGLPDLASAQELLSSLHRLTASMSNIDSVRD